MDAAYILTHSHVLNGGEEDLKLIGIYSSEALALAAATKLTSLPGFADSPERFHVSCYAIDQTHWLDGFVTVNELGEEGD